MFGIFYTKGLSIHLRYSNIKHHWNNILWKYLKLMLYSMHLLISVYVNSINLNNFREKNYGLRLYLTTWSVFICRDKNIRSCTATVWMYGDIICMPSVKEINNFLKQTAIQNKGSGTYNS